LARTQRRPRVPRHGRLALFAIAAALGAALILGVVDRSLIPRSSRVRSGPPILTVGRGKAFRLIQDAIDAAIPGSVVRVSPGVYAERLVIDKPLVLQGSGWQRTVIGDGQSWLTGLGRGTGATEARQGEGASGTGAQTQRSGGRLATILVRGADGVRIEGLSVLLRGAQPAGGRPLRPVAVEYRDAGGGLSGCFIQPAGHTGLLVAGTSEVTVSDTLVTLAVSGMEVRGTPGRSSAFLSGCEFRDCVIGAVAGPGAATTLTSTRFVGSMTVGLVCEDAPPVVRGCAFVGCGAAAVECQGTTELTLQYNVFKDNSTGVLATESSSGLVEHNTFVGGATGVEAGPESGALTVRGNVFCGCRWGVELDGWDRGAVEAGCPDAPTVTANVFWQNADHALASAPVPGASYSTVESLDVVAMGNRIEEPRFRDAGAGDFGVQFADQGEGRPAGVLSHIGLATQWPPVEKWPRALRDAASWYTEQAPATATGKTGQWGGHGAARPAGGAKPGD
jgi:hypothetical protein